MRLGAGGPKAFVPLAGRPMIEWSVAAFEAAPTVRAIVVACPPGHVNNLEGRDLTAVEGGAMRAESVRNALAAVKTDLVAIHDAARPLVSPDLIEEVIATLVAGPDAAGAIAAAPVTDTIKQIAPDPRSSRNAFSLHKDKKALHPAEIEGTLDRSRLWAAQTPQVFRVEALREALAGDSESVAAATDEAMLIETAGGRVLIHPAPAENLKVTRALDLRLAELLLSARAA